MSAVSSRVTPSSSARWIVAIDSASSRSAAPYAHVIPMQPSPIRPVSRPAIFMPDTLWLRGGRQLDLAEVDVGAGAR